MFNALCALQGRRLRAGTNLFGPALAALMLAASSAAWALSPPTLVVDGDADGVSDEIDDCPYTPPNTPVDAHGCSLAADGDADGVPDEVDDCPYTPKGARVDAHGCALDGDLDGVPDGIDQCPNTPYGEAVDARGCAPGSVAPRAAAPSAPAAVKGARKSRSRAAAASVSPAASATAIPAPQVAVPAATGAASLEAPAAVTAAPPPAAPIPAPPAVAEAPTLAESPAAASPPAASAVPAMAAPAVHGERLGLIRFRERSSEISEAELKHLQGLVDQLRPRLKAAPEARLSVIGHREAREAEGLDQRRAELVRSYLLARGLPVGAVRVGEAAATSSRRPESRAVELEWVPTPTP